MTTGWWVVALAACWSPSGTGPRSMVGVIRAPDGAPLASLSVETVESRWVTDAQGRFKVNYKEPQQWLEFGWSDLTWRRRYRPEDAGQDVVVALPEVREVFARCEDAEACDAVARWRLPDGLEALARFRCDPFEPALVSAPDGALPDEVVCRVSATSPDAPRVVRAADAPRTWRVTPPLVPITVRLSTDDGVAPRGCAVAVDGVPAAGVGDGTYRGEGYGLVRVEARCDGVPAPSAQIITREPAEVAVDWSPVSPVVDFSGVAPGAAALRVHAEEASGRSWRATYPAAEDGTFRLPPLAPGAYRFGLDATPEQVEGWDLALSPPHAEIRTFPVNPLDTSGPRVIGGYMVLERPLVEGRPTVMVEVP
jgi:hypothetical protein